MDLLTFFIGGVLMAFTPCMWPTYPIVASILTNKSKYGLVTYLLTSATIYAILGYIVGVGGIFIQPYLQSPIALTATASFLIVMAFVQFGWIRVPQFNFDFGSKELGPFFLAIVSTLCMSPCTTPILGAALGYIAIEGDILSGIVNFIALSFGINLPLILIGFIGIKVLPKGYKYMQYIKFGVGVLLIVAAAGTLTKLFPPPTSPLPQVVKHHKTFATAIHTSNLQMAARSSAVVTVYTATWCPNCHTFINNEVPAIRAAGISVQLIDVSNGAPAGITGVPTIIVSKNGRVVARHVGGVPAATIIAEAR